MKHDKNRTESEGLAHEAEHLLCKCKAQNSNPSPISPQKNFQVTWKVWVTRYSERKQS
jgi:hypothetical protein